MPGDFFFKKIFFSPLYTNKTYFYRSQLAYL